MTAEQAIHAFWSSFGLTAYDENSVPDNAQLPYITYSLSYDSFDNNVPMTASLWSQSTSWTTITNVANAISDYIGEESTILPTDKGGVRIWRGSPFYQRMGDVENNLKRIYINITAEYLQFN